MALVRDDYDVLVVWVLAVLVIWIERKCGRDVLFVFVFMLSVVYYCCLQ